VGIYELPAEPSAVNHPGESAPCIRRYVVAVKQCCGVNRELLVWSEEAKISVGPDG
jgi:hypothetical protein